MNISVNHLRKVFLYIFLMELHKFYKFIQIINRIIWILQFYIKIVPSHIII